MNNYLRLPDSFMDKLKDTYWKDKGTNKGTFTL